MFTSTTTLNLTVYRQKENKKFTRGLNLHVNLTTTLDLTIYRLGQYSVIISQ